MNIVKKYPVLGSSVDSGQLSLTIKGALLALVPVAVALLSVAGIDITENDLVEAINQLFIAFSAIVMVIGIGRKLYYKNRVK